MKMFRFQARHVFLTYPRCDLTKDELAQQLEAKFPIAGGIIAKESHADGTPHLHALLRMHKKMDSRDVGVFDVLGFHPNIQKANNIRAVETYLKKDGDWIEIGNPSDSPTDYFAQARSMNMEEWVNFSINERIPHPYMMMIWKMVNDCNTITEWDKEGTIDPRLDLYTFEDLYRGKPIIIKGPTGIGKTTWAKQVAPKPTLMVNHLDGLKEFKPGYHKSIIFDDMSFMHLPREAQIMIVDTDNARQIHVRYGVINLPAKIPKIFTTNVEIFIDDPAINRRYNKHCFA